MPGTEVTATWLNGMQEEIAYVIETAGLALNAGNNTLLWQALQVLSFAGNRADLTVDDRLNPPPGAPPAGALYIVGTAPTGAWVGQANKLARFIGGGWVFTAPVSGLQANYWSGGRQIVLVFDGADWIEDLATATAAGRVELATDAETQTGTDIARAITPAGLSARTATDTRTGLVELATQAEVDAGADQSRAVTPAGLRARKAAAFRMQKPSTTLPHNSNVAVGNYASSWSSGLSSALNTTAGTITISADDAGVWAFHAVCGTTGASTFEMFTISIAGVEAARIITERNTDNAGNDQSIAAIARVNAGDVVRIYYQQRNTGSSSDTTVNNDWCFFAGQRIGAQ